MKSLHVLGLIPIAMLTACQASNVQGSNNTGDDTAMLVGGPGSELWSTKTYSDPMDDVKVHEAFAEFESDNFRLQVRIKCRVGKGLSYEMSNFENGVGVPLRGVRTLMGRSFADIGARIDDGPAETWRVELSYNNAFTVKDENDKGERWLKIVTIVNEDVASGRPKGYSLFASRMGVSNSIVLRIALQTGEANYRIDQSDTNVRSVLSQCPPKAPFEPETALEENTPAEGTKPSENQQAVEDSSVTENRE